MSESHEHEILWTGIGGQGVQLAAKILAAAATLEGRQVMSLGTYGGTMRGGNTDATIVIANGRIQSPPMVSRAWAALVSHPRFFEPMAPKLHDGSLLFVDGDLLELEGPLPDTPAEVIAVAATKLAREADAPKAASLVLLGAFARGTGIVGAEALDAALADSLPSYRQQFLDSNQRALRAGWEAVPALAWPAWQSEAA